MNAVPLCEPRPCVLIVDDEPSIAEVYVELLRMEGADVYLAASGEEAFALLSRIPVPQVVYVDCLMPTMSGEAFVRELAESWPEVRRRALVVGMSGLDARAPSTRSFASVVDVLESKPSDLDVFVALHQQNLARAQVRS